MNFKFVFITCLYPDLGDMNPFDYGALPISPDILAPARAFWGSLYQADG